MPARANRRAISAGFEQNHQMVKLTNYSRAGWRANRFFNAINSQETTMRIRSLLLATLIIAGLAACGQKTDKAAESASKAKEAMSQAADATKEAAAKAGDAASAAADAAKDSAKDAMSKAADATKEAADKAAAATKEAADKAKDAVKN